MVIHKKHHISYILILAALATTSSLFAPWGGSTIYNGDSHSSIPAIGYISGTPGRTREMLDPDLGPSKMSSRIPCIQTCSYTGPGPCNQNDWSRLK